jgi:DNA-binding transcriptional MerR regulator
MKIGEVARRTGTTTALLRAWETRHRVLTPARTVGGQRLYSERDVERVRRVQQLLSEGWSVPGAVARLRATGGLPHEPSAPTTRETDGGEPQHDRALPLHHRGLTPSRIEMLTPLDSVDPDALHVALDTVRAMLRAASAAEVRDTLVAMVERLGGTTGPAATQDGGVIPVDLSFGEGPPLLPRADAASVARMRLELLLPPLVEDARALAHRLGRADRSVADRV